MGQYREVDYKSSSNRAASLPRVRPAIGTLLHTTSGTDSASILQGLQEVSGKVVSAHALIGRDGTRYLLFSTDRVTFHAGATWWPGDRSRGVDAANEVFIGVELECMDNQRPTYEQLDSFAEYLVLLSLGLMWRWPYVLYGHYALAVPLGRRSDPVRLDWGALMGRIYWHALAAKLAGM